MGGVWVFSETAQYSPVLQGNEPAVLVCKFQLKYIPLFLQVISVIKSCEFINIILYENDNWQCGLIHNNWFHFYCTSPRFPVAVVQK